MSPSTLSHLVALAVSASIAAAQVTGTYPATPLASKGPFAYPTGIVRSFFTIAQTFFVLWTFVDAIIFPTQPYKVDTDQGLVRGTQLGYNICNSTTEGPTSLCQTSFINTLDGAFLYYPRCM